MRFYFKKLRRKGKTKSRNISEDYRHHILGQQNIPFRGKNWDKETKQEYGNFTRFLRWKAEDVPALKDHLDNASYDAKYTSPDIQNQLINLAGLHIISQLSNM